MILPEHLRPGPFRIEVFNPEGIYQAVVAAEQSRSQEGLRLSGVLSLGTLFSETGLFSKMDAAVAVSSIEDAVLPTVNLRYRQEHNAYWQEDDIENLQGNLSRLYAPNLVQYGRTPMQENVLVLEDQLEQTRYIINLGFDNQADKWIAQVKTIDALRRESVPSEQEIFKTALQRLIQSPYPLEEINQSFVTMMSISMDVALPLERTGVVLTDQVDFVRKILSFSHHAEGIINVIAKVKGVSQTGVLTLRPPTGNS